MGEGCQGAELMEPPAFGPGHSQPLPSPAWEGLRAFLQPLVGPPRLPTLLAVDLLSSPAVPAVTHSPRPTHQQRWGQENKFTAAKQLLGTLSAGNTTVLFRSWCGVATACRPSPCTSSTGDRGAHHVSHRVPTSHPEWDAAPPI